MTGSLEVTANIEGATVYVDGEAAGEAPVRLGELSMGRHGVRVEATGFQTFERTINISSGRETRVEAVLRPPPVVLRVESDVPGATVFVNVTETNEAPTAVNDNATTDEDEAESVPPFPSLMV